MHIASRKQTTYKQYKSKSLHLCSGSCQLMYYMLQLTPKENYYQIIPLKTTYRPSPNQALKQAVTVLISLS